MVDSFTRRTVLILLFLFFMKGNVEATNFLQGFKGTVASSYILVSNLIKKTQTLPLVPRYSLLTYSCKTVQLFCNFM